MPQTRELIHDFLQGRRLAVAGVSRGSGSAANPVFRRLRDAGYEVVPVNPNAAQVEGTACYPDLASAPGPLDGVVIATHPEASVEIARQAVALRVPRVWFHRSLGQGSVSDAAVRECVAGGVACIVGGCPLMYCGQVDVAHRCLRWWLDRRGRIAAA